MKTSDAKYYYSYLSLHKFNLIFSFHLGFHKPLRSEYRSTINDVLDFEITHNKAIPTSPRIDLYKEDLFQPSNTCYVKFVLE